MTKGSYRTPELRSKGTEAEAEAAWSTLLASLLADLVWRFAVALPRRVHSHVVNSILCASISISMPVATATRRRVSCTISTSKH
jgi:hypothetical protein